MIRVLLALCVAVSLSGCVATGVAVITVAGAALAAAPEMACDVAKARAAFGGKIPDEKICPDEGH